MPFFYCRPWLCVSVVFVFLVFTQFLLEHKINIIDFLRPYKVQRPIVKIKYPTSRLICPVNGLKDCSDCRVCTRYHRTRRAYCGRRLSGNRRRASSGWHCAVWCRDGQQVTENCMVFRAGVDCDSTQRGLFKDSYYYLPRYAHRVPLSLAKRPPFSEKAPLLQLYRSRRDSFYISNINYKYYDCVYTQGNSKYYLGVTGYGNYTYKGNSSNNRVTYDTRYTHNGNTTKGYHTIRVRSRANKDYYGYSYLGGVNTYNISCSEYNTQNINSRPQIATYYQRNGVYAYHSDLIKRIVGLYVTYSSVTTQNEKRTVRKTIMTTTTTSTIELAIATTIIYNCVTTLAYENTIRIIATSTTATRIVN